MTASKVLIVSSPKPETSAPARLLASRLAAVGIEAIVHPLQDSSPAVSPDTAAAADSPAPDSPAPETADFDVSEIALVVPMGGDGTFLAATRLIDFAPIPLLAFNYGRLAFLAGNPERDEVELVTDALAGDIRFERRATLDATVTEADGSETQFTALNEIVYARGASGQVVEFGYGVSGTSIAHLKADGLVVATATGSTGYALSVGGPVVSPGYAGLVVVPIAPHALNTRAIVCGPSDVIEVDIDDALPGETSVFVDGQTTDISQPAHLQVQRGEREVLFALGGGDFFTNVSRVFFGSPA